MRMNLRRLICLLAVALGLSVLPQNCFGVSACLSARFNDYADFGCHRTPGRPGASASSTSNAGGNQAQCIGCKSKNLHGMPAWWVSEPYIDLFVADEPLSYTTSSGQEMVFRWTYRERGLLINTPWWKREEESLGLVTPNAYVQMRYSLNEGPGITAYMTNASWQHNWWSEIVFWDPFLETNSTAPTVTVQLDSSFNPTNAYLGYTANYQGLVYQGNGGVINFDVTAASTATTSGQIRIQVLNQTNSNNGPQIPRQYSDSNGLLVNPYPISGTFFVTNPFSGFKVIFPDGSQDIYGLVLAHADATKGGFPNNSPPRDSTASAYLTERIDPQGRPSWIGYYANTNVIFTNGLYKTNFLGYTVKYVVDSDGRTNTYTYDTSNVRELVSITDPYGRTAQFSPDSHNGFSAITDAVTNTTSFSYSSRSNGWMTQMVTPYGTTTFTNYELQETGATNEFEQRAIYVSEPDGAEQLFFYDHQATSGVPSATNSPSVPGESYDNGSNGALQHSTLIYRDSFHWGRRQFEALSSSVVSQFHLLQNLPQDFDFATALGSLTAADFTKGHLSHWMLGADLISVTETLSAERDPSPDSAGQTPGQWTFYGNGNNSSTPQIDQGVQVSSIARLLPDGSSQYTRYHYSIYSPFVVSDNETSITLPDSTLGERTNSFQYASTNLIDLLHVADTMNQTVQFAYNANHQVTTNTDALSQITKLTYNTNTHNLSGISLPSGEQITLTYYGAGTNNTSQMLQQIEVEPQGRFINITDYTNGLPHIVHVSGTSLVDLWVTNFWDGLNRLTGRAFQDGSTVSNVYTILDLTAQKDRRDHWTYFGYDPLDHLTTITNALTNVTTLTWCDCGALSTITDALSNKTTLNYDNQGRMTTVVFADTSSLTYDYDLPGRTTSITDGSTRSVTLDYNNQGLPISVSNPYGTVLQVVYDVLDRPRNVTDANGITVSNTFDALYRILGRTWPDNHGESFVYATNGLVTYTNRDQKATHFGRDNAGRLIAVTNANQEVTSFGYDAADRIFFLYDGLLNTTIWNYNQFGWLMSKSDGLGNTIITNGYDPNGELTNRWTPAGGTTIYRYDAVGNLTNVDYSGATISTPSISLAYDPLNRLTNMLDGVGTTVFGYTATGQLQSEAGPWASDTVSYGYTQGQRTGLSLTQPSASAWAQSYVYDSMWRLQTLTSPAGTFGYGYGQLGSASSLIQSIALPNFASITNHYDSLGRQDVTALVNYWGQNLDAYSYQFDLLGLRTNVTRNLGLTTSSVSVGYDNIGQLTHWNAQESGGASRLNEQLTYGFDAADNLHTRTSGGLVQTFTVDAANELTSVTRNSTMTLSGALPAPATGSVMVNGQAAQSYGDFTFARTNISLSNSTNTFTIAATNVYGVATTNVQVVNLPSTVTLQKDANGNLTGDGTRTFVFDAENQLTNVNVTGQWKTEFAYDGLGRRRIARDYAWQGSNWVRTNETRYVFDGMLSIQERDSNNVPLVSYTRGLDLSLGLQGAGGIGGLLARTDGSGSTFYHADGSGNVTALMDGTQDIVARYEYDPFGRLIGKWGTMADVNRFRFSSKEVHPNSGLYYYGYRFYEPNLQRWINRDPIGEWGGVNLYRFVGNSSLNAVDEMGLQLDSVTANAGQSADAAAYLKEIRDAKNYEEAVRKALQDYAEAQAREAAIKSGIAAGATVILLNNGDMYSPPDPNIGYILKEGEYRDHDGNIRDADGDIVRDKNGNGVKKACNWKSVKQFGHTFLEHGAKRPLQELIDRAAAKGPQGQWLDNEKAALYLSQFENTLSGNASVPIPQGLGQVVYADGTVVNATHATIILNQAGGIKTAYPIP